MDQEKIRQSAEQLDQLLSKYAPVDKDAASLRYAIKGCIQDALEGRITIPLQWRKMPGGRLFTETNLRNYRDLENAYSKFKIEVTGDSENPALEYISARMAEKRKLPQS